MGLETFMDKFSDDTPGNQPLGLLDQWAATSAPGALDKFIDKFQGVTEPYYFYHVDGKPTVELRFQTDEHIYYLVGPLGQLTPQDGVTTICHIIDKSPALVPWSAKMVVQKLLRTMPTTTKEVASGLPTLHEFDKTKDCCGCGWKNNPRSIDHWEAQWARHKHESEVPPKELVTYIAEMTLEAFEKICLEAKSAPRDKLEEAGDVGHMAHTWLEYFIKAVIARDVQQQQYKLANMPADERARNCVMAALGWMKTHNVRWIETERKIYSKKYSYAGTMDGLAIVDSCDDPLCRGCAGEVFKDRLSIIDWKSSNYLYIEYLYQTAAYEAAYEEEFGVEVEDRWILRLGKEDGEFDPWHTTEGDFQEDFEGFLDALSLTRSVHLTEERMKGQKRMRKETFKAVKEAQKEAEKAAKKEARAQAVAERRAKKALEKEAAKVAKRAERAALKAQIVEAGAPEAVAELCVDADKAKAFVDKYIPVGTITGRMTVSSPELQTIEEVEHVPDRTAERLPETVMTMDFSEIERRVLATLPEEELVQYQFGLPAEV